MEIACLDLEGVLVPEIWINVAERTGIAELRATTRDIPDYDELMQQRIELLRKHSLRLSDIQEVIGSMGPLEGALDFINWLRPRFQVAILSDTFYEFAKPLMRSLGWPTLLCHHLVIDDDKIVGYRLRQPLAKRCSVEAFRQLKYRTIAVGDSYNDIQMLEVADAGILFRPPQNVIDEFPQFPVTTDYAELRTAFSRKSQDLR